LKTEVEENSWAKKEDLVEKQNTLPRKKNNSAGNFIEHLKRNEYLTFKMAVLRAINICKYIL
jgi:hypothetical protein